MKFIKIDNKYTGLKQFKQDILDLVYHNNNDLLKSLLEMINWYRRYDNNIGCTIHNKLREFIRN